MTKFILLKELDEGDLVIAVDDIHSIEDFGANTTKITMKTAGIEWKVTNTVREVYDLILSVQSPGTFTMHSKTGCPVCGDDKRNPLRVEYGDPDRPAAEFEIADLFRCSRCGVVYEGRK